MKKPRTANSKEVLAYVNRLQKVRVYRNLHKKCLSVKQGGIVQCHTDNIVLRDCKFIVSKGYVVNARKTDDLLPMWDSLYYNPYKCEGFTNDVTGKIAASSEYCEIDHGDIVPILAFNAVYPLTSN